MHPYQQSGSATRCLEFSFPIFNGIITSIPGPSVGTARVVNSLRIRVEVPQAVRRWPTTHAARCCLVVSGVPDTSMGAVMDPDSLFSVRIPKGSKLRLTKEVRSAVSLPFPPSNFTVCPLCCHRDVHNSVQALRSAHPSALRMLSSMIEGMDLHLWRRMSNTPSV